MTNNKQKEETYRRYGERYSIYKVAETADFYFPERETFSGIQEQLSRFREAGQIYLRALEWRMLR